MKMKLFTSLILSVFILFQSGCSKVLSIRTDEQAWIEFDTESKVSRKPAEVNSLKLKEALSRIPVRTLLLKCGSQVSPEVCYRAGLTLQFDEAFRFTQAEAPSTILDYKKEQKEFFEMRSYANIFAQVNHFHQSILSGIELKARERAESFFEDCDHEKNRDQVIEHFDLIFAGVGEIPKGAYACLVAHITEDESKLLAETADRVGLNIVTPEAKAWIQSRQINQIYLETISGLIKKKNESEKFAFEKEKANLLKDLNPKESEEKLLKVWAPVLREKFPYSPVEQWISLYRQEHRP